MNGSCPSLGLDLMAHSIGDASVGMSVKGCPYDASDANDWELERFQFVVGQGPSADVVGWSRGSRVADVMTAGMWPLLNEYLLARSVEAVFSVPLTVDSQQSFGALTVYRYEVGELTASERQTLEEGAKDVASAVASHVASDQVNHFAGCGLRHIDLLNRAIGVVIGDLGIGRDEASARIRSYSYAAERTLDDVIDGLLSQDIRLTPN